jgi:hypothetical protein
MQKLLDAESAYPFIGGLARQTRCEDSFLFRNAASPLLNDGRLC